MLKLGNCYKRHHTRSILDQWT